MSTILRANQRTRDTFVSSAADRPQAASTFERQRHLGAVAINPRFAQTAGLVRFSAPKNRWLDRFGGRRFPDLLVHACVSERFVVKHLSERVHLLMGRTQIVNRFNRRALVPHILEWVSSNVEDAASSFGASPIQLKTVLNGRPAQFATAVVLDEVWVMLCLQKKESPSLHTGPKVPIVNVGTTQRSTATILSLQMKEFP
jgi:hypothetical protein